MQSTLVTEKIPCYHCGEGCPSSGIRIEDKIFCCTGCKTVYEILEGNELCNYYSIEKSPGSKPSHYENKFDYLDDEKITAKLLDFRNESAAFVTFHIPQIHCSSCIWILENLYKLNPGIYHSEVNFLSKTVLIKFRVSDTTLKEVVKTLSSIGYEPLIQLEALDRKKQNQHDHRILYQLGVAGFCFGNIMLFSFPEYLSIDITETFYRNLFGWLNFILSLPVLFFSAQDYFTSAFASLRKKIININLPLSIGIAVLFSRSCFELFTGTGAGYFDSMTGLVFLLLIGKYVQQRTYSSLNFERDYKSYFPLSVIKKEKGEEKSVPVSSLKKGDRILIRNNEIIPADSILFSGNGFIDYSFITGESAIAEIKPGEFVYAGGRQNGSTVQLEILKEVSQSYLTRLWNNPAFSKIRDKDFTHFTNMVSRHFTLGIIIVSVLSGLLWLPDTYTAMDVFTAVLIVACPCALALSVPFTFGNAMRIFGRNKFYLKNSLSIEDLSKTDAVVLDKTGTLTRIDESSIHFHGRKLTHYEEDLVKTAAANSIHPLSRRISESLHPRHLAEADSYKELPGDGVEAVFDGTVIRLGTLSFVSGEVPEQQNLNITHVHLAVNDEYAGYFEISNSYREGIFDEIRKLRKQKDVYLLSGDNEGEKEKLLPHFENESKLLFNAAPSDKLEFVKSLQLKGKKVLMIGDGLNDAGALAQSDFGIAVTEDISNFSPACDAILDSKSLDKMSNFLKFSEDSAKIIHLNFIISLIYNLGGLSFAVNALLTPLIAAVLMPVSSLTVVAVASIGTSILARKRGLKFQ